MSYNFDTSHDSKNYTPAGESLRIFGRDRVIEGITIHWWGDPNQNPQFDTVRDYLCSNSSNTSAHYVATGTGRQVACIVAPGDVAHATGNAWGNARTINIELDPRGRDEDFDVGAELIADIRSAYGDVPLYWHSYFTSTRCAGVYTDQINRLDQLSYTKFSAPVEWGQGGDINPKAPAITTATPTPIELPVPVPVDPTPSPTTHQPDGTPLPDTGKPVTEKNDFPKEPIKEEPVNQPTSTPTPKVAAVGTAGAAIAAIVTLLALTGVTVPDGLSEQATQAVAAVLVVTSFAQAAVQFIAGYLKKSNKVEKS